MRTKKKACYQGDKDKSLAYKGVEDTACSVNPQSSSVTNQPDLQDKT